MGYQHHRLKLSHYLWAPNSCLVAPFLIQLSSNGSGKKEKMSHTLEPLQLMWETQMTLQVPGFGLAQTCPLQSLGG